MTKLNNLVTCNVNKEEAVWVKQYDVSHLNRLQLQLLKRRGKHEYLIITTKDWKKHLGITTSPRALHVNEI